MPFSLVYRPLETDEARNRAAEAATSMPAPSKLQAERWADRGWWIGIPSLGGDQPWEEFYQTIQSILPRYAPLATW